MWMKTEDDRLINTDHLQSIAITESHREFRVEGMISDTIYFSLSPKYTTREEAEQWEDSNARLRPTHLR